MATTPRTMLAALALVGALGALGGCSGKEQQTEPTSDGTPEVTATEDATPTPDATPTETPPAEDDGVLGEGVLPPGFPDPATLIGQVVHEERAADGSWHTVVGGAPLTLATMLGACFDGGSGDVCGYSISASVPAPNFPPQLATAVLVLLLRDNGSLADGTPTWVVLDAVITTAPGGEPAYLEVCDGADGVVIWADPGAPPGDTITATAAWGPDASVTSLVEVDPATLSCPWMGD